MLACEVHGLGKNLVLIHGWGASRQLWRAWALEHFADYRVTLIDLPGHGDSESLSITDEQLADAWQSALLAVIPERAIVVGWSLGGLLAQRIALTHPERVECLILLASSPCFVQRDDWMPALASSLFARYLSEVMTQTSALLKSFAALQVLGAAQPKLVLKQLLPVVSALSEAHVPSLYQGLRLLQVLDFRDQLNRLSMPTLWLWGTDDAIVPSVVADAVRQLQPAAYQQQVVAGHLLFLSAGAAVSAAMRDFIEGTSCD